MATVWQNTKILLAPSLWHESGSRTIVEACSAGIPVLATASGGNPELLGDAGWIFPIPDELKENFVAPPVPESVGPWVDTIEMLVSDPDAYASASARAKKRWNALNESNSAARLEKIFGDVIEKVQEKPSRPS
jgi:glycosyltransferase involved in cell wall biosynthesis